MRGVRQRMDWRQNADPASIPEETSFSRIALVGRYALNFVFSDGHETGIFSFDYLRRLSAAS